MDLKESLFENHYNYYKNIGVETIKQQAGQVEQVSSDYQGRVIYELLQNSFDKAKNKILVRLSGNTLYIANDGGRFTYTSGYDYDGGSSTRGDFQSMCSISTSTKSVSGSIGNKGVGFKSSFSVSARGYVNVYSSGTIFHEGANHCEDICFRIYNMFKNDTDLTAEFPSHVRQDINSALNSVRQERLDRGIPGFYFPILLQGASKEAEVILKNGYVTVIEIPLEINADVQGLMDEIRSVHFDFVKIKYPHFNNTLRIDFESGKQNFTQHIGESDGFFTVVVNNPKLKAAAKAAGVIIDKFEIGLRIRDTGGGLLYNYLPTKVNSPFPYVDLHADFHTTVDRKTINFDGTVGKYNLELYRCCIELYFAVLQMQLADPSACSLKLQYINLHPTQEKSFFRPSLLAIKEPIQPLYLYYMIRDILGIENHIYSNAARFLVELGKHYFGKKGREAEIHETYLKNICDFAAFSSRTDGDNYKWVTQFKREIAAEMKDSGTAFIPGVALSDSSELFFRKSIEDRFKLPSSLKVSITEFKVPDDELLSALGIKELSDTNEVLKYFKQCSFTGDVNTSSISEKKQLEILSSAYKLFRIKKEKISLTTHRFRLAATGPSRDRNSTANQANFHVATLFLKTHKKRYKPAQLCMFSEIDLSFLPKQLKSDRDAFLKFLGVSFDKEYVFADVRMHKKLNKGLTSVPAPLDRSKHKETISGELISNLYLISKNEAVHPALINNNDYRFLSAVYRASIRDELDNLHVKDYKNFMPEYKNILISKIKSSLAWRADVIRFYGHTYKLFEKEDQFLIQENGCLKWIHGKDFKMVRSRLDFDLYGQVKDRNLLCYFNVQEVSDDVRECLVIPKKGNINILGHEEDSHLAELVKSKFLYLLLSISYSNHSEVNFLRDDKDVNAIQQRLQDMVIIKGTGLMQEVYFGDDRVISDKTYAFNDKDRKSLYLEKGSSNRQTANGISEFFFDNLSISESIELILFHKDIAALRMEFDSKDVAVINRKWKDDFSSRFKAFCGTIENFFSNGPIEDENWFVYNTHHKSSFLITVDNQGRLEELVEFIKALKEEEIYEGYFEGFGLEVENGEILRRVAALHLAGERINELAPELKKRLLALRPVLGSETELSALEEKVKEGKSVFTSEELDKKERQVELSSRADRIFDNLASIVGKQTKDVMLKGGEQSALAARKKKFVFTESGAAKTTAQDLEIVGATGEEEVLSYFILEFLKLEPEKQKKAIEEIYIILKSKIRLDALEHYKKSCYDSIGDDQKLGRCLIPFFYVAMHEKYAYFDMIVFFKGSPALVEVKTSRSEASNRFFMSIAEVDAARGADNYQLVRVTPSTISFLGNPVKSIEKHLSLVKGDNFTITPKNYEVRLT